MPASEHNAVPCLSPTYAVALCPQLCAHGRQGGSRRRLLLLLLLPWLPGVLQGGEGALKALGPAVGPPPQALQGARQQAAQPGQLLGLKRAEQGPRVATLGQTRQVVSTRTTRQDSQYRQGVRHAYRYVGEELRTVRS